MTIKLMNDIWEQSLIVLNVHLIIILNFILSYFLLLLHQHQHASSPPLYNSPASLAITRLSIQRRSREREREMVVIGEESRVDIGRIEEYEEEGCISKREEDEECRICHEEAEKTAMETPCACNGTLKVMYIYLVLCLEFIHLSIHPILA